MVGGGLGEFDDDAELVSGDDADNKISPVYSEDVGQRDVEDRWHSDNDDGSYHVTINGAILMNELCFARCFVAASEKTLVDWCECSSHTEWHEREHRIRFSDGQTVWLRFNGPDPIALGCTINKHRVITPRVIKDTVTTSKGKRKEKKRRYPFSEVSNTWWIRQVMVPRKKFPTRLLWMGYTVDVCTGQQADAGHLFRQDRLIVGVMQEDITMHRGDITSADEGVGATYNVFGELDDHSEFNRFTEEVFARGSHASSDVLSSGIGIIAHVRHFTCHKSEATSCGICLEGYDETVEKCGYCGSSFCTGCVKGWLKAVGDSCPYCRQEFHVPDRMVCVPCSHATLRVLFGILGNPGESKSKQAFILPSGCHVQRKKLAKHEGSTRHKFCVTRYPWVNGPGICEDDGVLFKKELAQHATALDAAGVQSSFHPLDRLQVDDVQENDQQADQHDSHPPQCVIVGNITVPSEQLAATKRMMQVIFGFAKKLEPPSAVKNFFDIMRVSFGDVIGGEMPDTHGATANPEKSIRKAVRAISFGLHKKLIRSIHRKRHTIYDGNGNMMHLSDPFKLAFDGYSAGSRSFLPVMVNVFPTACVETTGVRLLSCADGYGDFDTFTGGSEERDTTATGLHYTLKQVITKPQFKDIRPADVTLGEHVLGYRHFTENCVEVSGDQGGGMPNCMKELLLKIPDLPDTRGESHLLQILLKRCRELPDVGEACRDCYDMVTSIGTTLAGPKRAAFATRRCTIAGLKWVQLQPMVPNRWAPSTRALLESIILQLQSVQYVVECFLNKEMYLIKNQSFRLVLEQCQTALVNHETLLWLHQWYDILDAISVAIKRAEPGSASILAQYANRTALNARLDSLSDEKKCVALQQYRKGLSQKDGRVYVAYRRLDNETGRLQTYWKSLGTEADIETFDGRFGMDRLEFLNNLEESVKREMPVTEEMASYNTLYNPRAIIFDNLSGLSGRAWFVQSFTKVVARYRRRYPAWITHQYIVEQAQALRDLLWDNRQRLEQIARNETEKSFWLAVRKLAEDPNINISLVLYFRMKCLVRNGQEAFVEQFLSLMHRWGEDKQRQTLSGSNLEAMLRCAFNGPSLADFNPDEFIADWLVAFKMDPVRTVDEVAESLEVNTVVNARARLNYDTNPQQRLKRKLRARDKYKTKTNEQKKSRGEVSTAVKGNSNAARRALRGLEPAKRKHREEWVSDDEDSQISMHSSDVTDEFEDVASDEDDMLCSGSVENALRVQTGAAQRVPARKKVLASEPVQKGKQAQEEEKEDRGTSGVVKVPRPAEKGDIIVCAGDVGDVPWIAVVVTDQTNRDPVSVRWLRPFNKNAFTGRWVEMKGKVNQTDVQDDAVLGTILWENDNQSDEYMGVSNWKKANEWWTEHHSLPDI